MGKVRVATATDPGIASIQISKPAGSLLPFGAGSSKQPL